MALCASILRRQNCAKKCQHEIKVIQKELFEIPTRIDNQFTGLDLRAPCGKGASTGRSADWKQRHLENPLYI